MHWYIWLCSHENTTAGIDNNIISFDVFISVSVVKIVTCTATFMEWSSLKCTNLNKMLRIIWNIDQNFVDLIAAFQTGRQRFTKPINPHN